MWRIGARLMICLGVLWVVLTAPFGAAILTTGIMTIVYVVAERFFNWADGWARHKDLAKAAAERRARAARERLARERAAKAALDEEWMREKKEAAEGRQLGEKRRGAV